MEVMQEAGRKRETSTATEKAGQGRRRTLRKVTKTEYPSILLSKRDSVKRAVEERMKNFVALWNAENPNSTPIVVDELTDDERAELLQKAQERAQKQAREYMARQIAEDMESLEAEKPDPNLDSHDLAYADYRDHWEMKWGSEFGSFEDNTRIPAMRFTEKALPGTIPTTTLQIYSAKLSSLSGSLQYPFHVFGLIAVRDDVDHNRNVVFKRSRDNCQTLTEQEPYLVLTGPVRAALVEYGSLYFDVMLKVRGSTESEDKLLSLLAVRYYCCNSSFKSCVSTHAYRSKLSILELTCGMVVSSVEATISMRVVEGSWPDGLSAQFSAWNTSLSHMKVLLLDSGNEKVMVAAADGKVELTRHVVSVETFGELRICAEVWQGSIKVMYREVFFTPLKAGRSYGMLNVGACKIEVAVAWSLLPIV